MISKIAFVDAYAAKLYGVKQGSDEMMTNKYSACLDLRCTIPVVMNAFSMCQQPIPVGFHLEVDNGYFGLILSRSGLAMKGITVVGGVIDADYRGEIKVLLLNQSSKVVSFEPGDRIAQLTALHHEFTNFRVVSFNKLSVTERGAKGFLSSGLK